MDQPKDRTPKFPIPVPEPAEATDPDALDGSSSEGTMEALLTGQAELADKVKSRGVVRVRVVQVLEDRVLVDIGEKHEGVVWRSELADDEVPKPEDQLPVVLEKRGRGEDPAVLSYKKAKALLGWEALKEAAGQNQRVRGRVLQWIKGGYKVDAEGVEAFMPISQSELRTPPRHRLPVGAKVKCYVVELQEDRRQVVLSRRKVLEEEEGKRRQELLGQIKVGETRRGWISHVTEFGVFVNLGGLEGLVHVSDIDWKEPEKAKALHLRGQRVSVKVLRIDEDGKVSLGMKQLKPNPADLLRKKYPPKAQVKAKIVSLTKEGAKAEIGPDAAWVALEEFGDPAPKEGDVVRALVLGIRGAEYDVNLSIKRFEDIEDRKKIQKYLKKAPPLTLGQLLSPSDEQ